MEPNASDSFWDDLIKKFNKKLVGWKGLLLSQARKIQLIKSTLQNLPTYALSLFKFQINMWMSLKEFKRDSFGKRLKITKYSPLYPRIKSACLRKGGDLVLGN